MNEDKYKLSDDELERVKKLIQSNLKVDEPSEERLNKRITLAERYYKKKYPEKTTMNPIIQGFFEIHKAIWRILSYRPALSGIVGLLLLTIIYYVGFYQSEIPMDENIITQIQEESQEPISDTIPVEDNGPDIKIVNETKDIEPKKSEVVAKFELPKQSFGFAKTPTTDSIYLSELMNRVKNNTNNAFVINKFQSKNYKSEWMKFESDNSFKSNYSRLAFQLQNDSIEIYIESSDTIQNNTAIKIFDKEKLIKEIESVIDSTLK